MESSINFSGITGNQKIIEGLNIIEELTHAIKKEERQNLQTETATTFVVRVNNQLRELATRLSSAQNAITKNQMLLSTLNQVKSIVSALPHSDKNQIILQINSIISHAIFNNEPLIRDIPNSLDLVNDYIKEQTEIAVNSINSEIENIRKINVAYENIIATKYNPENFNSVIDLLANIKKELINSKVGINVNIQSPIVQQLL